MPTASFTAILLAAAMALILAVLMIAHGDIAKPDLGRHAQSTQSSMGE